MPISPVNDTQNDQEIEQRFKKMKNQYTEKCLSRKIEFNKKKEFFQIEIKNAYESLLKTEKQNIQLKIRSPEQCLKDYQVLRDQLQNSSKWINDIFLLEKIPLFHGLNNKDISTIRKATKKYIDNVMDKVTKDIKDSKILNLTQIQNNFKKWVQIMQESLNQLISEIQRLKSQWLYGSISIKQNIIRSILFGVILQVTIKNVYENNLKVIKDEEAEILKLIQTKEQEVKDSLKCRDQIGGTLNLWTKILVNQISEKMNQQCFTKIKLQLLKIRNQLDPQKIFDRAIEQFLNAADGKNKWIQCFKLVVNINEYLFEILCKQQTEIITRSAIIVEKISQAKKLSSIEINKKIQQLRNLNKSNQTVASSYLKQNGFLFIQNEKFTREIILRLFEKKLQQEQKNIQLQINEKLDIDLINVQVQKFIENELRHTIIGCQSRCPMCGMKCMKARNHSDSHEVKAGTHMMKAFAGMTIKKTSTPCYDVCFTKQGLENSVYSGQIKFPNVKQYIIKKYPEWEKHFPSPDQSYLYQGDSQKSNYAKIWVNIQDMIIKYRHTTMIKDGKYDLMKNNPLIDIDLDCKYPNYKGQMGTIRQRYLS